MEHYTSDNNCQNLLIDTPIESKGQDILGRALFAQKIADSISGLQSEAPIVMGLSAPWGAGKTSVLNLVEEVLSPDENVVVFRYNPWWFSGEESQLLSFLTEFGKILSVNFNGQAGKTIGKYVQLFAKVLKPSKYLPVVGPAGELLSDVLKYSGEAIEQANQLARDDAWGIKQEIDKLIMKENKTLVVLIDDLDRLLPSEAIQMIKIVKSVADFPKTRYLMAYDSESLAEMISSETRLTNGAEYLAKIIQIPVELPIVKHDKLRSYFFGQLDKMLETTNKSRIDEKRFWNLYYRSISELLNDLRKIKRLLNSITLTYSSVKDEVDVADFVGIHAIHVFCPELFRFIRNNENLLIEDAGHGDIREKRQKKLEEFYQSNNIQSIFIDIIKELFPRLTGSYASGFDSQWETQLRICSKRHFPKYFHWEIPEDFFTEQEKNTFLGMLSNEDRIKSYIRTNAGTRMGEILEVLNENVRQNCFSLDLQKLLFERLFQFSDILIDSRDIERKTFLHIDNRIRLSWIYQGILEHIPSNKRLEFLKNLFRKYPSYRMMLGFTYFLAACAGIRGSEKSPQLDSLLKPEEATVLLDCVDQEVTMASDKACLKTKTPLALARDWAMVVQDDTKAKRWISTYIKGDEHFIFLLAEAYSEISSHGMNDRVATTRGYATLDWVGQYVDDMQAFRERVEKLARKKAIKDEKAQFVAQEVLRRVDVDGQITISDQEARDHDK